MSQNARLVSQKLKKTGIFQGIWLDQISLSKARIIIIIKYYVNNRAFTRVGF